MRSLLAVPFLLAVSAGSASAGVTVIAPRDGGVVLGDVAIVEVAGSTRPPVCRLDGAQVSTQWTRSPRRGRWVAEIPVPSAGPHVLEVRGRPPGLLHWFRALRRDRVRFDAGADDAVALGDAVADHFLDHEDPHDLAWQWGPAVCLYGLHRLATVSPHRRRYADAIAAYYDHHEAAGRPPIDYPDRCAPALAALALERTEGRREGIPAARDVARYVRNERRNALGAIDHLDSSSCAYRLATRLAPILRFVPLPWGAQRVIARWARSIWVDSLVMYALFAAQWGEETGDPSLRAFGLEQPGIFARVLQDPTSGLFHHAWDVGRSRPLGARWLRGNGWVAMSIVELLEEAPPGHPRRPELLAIYRDLVQGLLARQLPNGLWPTVLDDSSTYAESSGSALVAYAIARGVRRGYLPPARLDAAKRTFRSLAARLEPRSRGYAVTGTSIATSVWPEPVYRLIPRKADVDYGVGAFLLLASELEGESWR